ncbi:MAG TPA: hypothetical protein VNB22_10610 [Pyrinomonadaceae bacterium]|nr:hypothetical protein [Pyrinomonadaceae bacterium]
MSFELSVHTPEILTNLESSWLKALSEEGLICEFHPSFSVNSWGGGLLPEKVQILKNSFPTSNKYGEDPLLAGFELDVDAYEKSVFEINETSQIEVCRFFFFRTAMRRSVIDLRLQCFAAATLANMLNGVVIDHQAGENFTGQEALKNAERESKEYEDFYEKNFSELALFDGWN